MEYCPCPFCGTFSAEHITTRGQFGLPAYVAICRNDGLVYLNPRWSKAKYQDFYRHEYDSYYRPLLSGPIAEALTLKKASEIYARLSRWLTPPTRSILDIGAGMGGTLDYFKSMSGGLSRLAAIEPSSACRESLEKLGQIDLISEDVDSDWLDGNAGRFDVIVMRHVLEHLLDPAAAIRRISAALSRDGVAYIAVPDMMNPQHSLNQFWFRAVHTFYFSKVTFAALTEMGGLTALRIEEEPTGEIWGVFARGSAPAAAARVNVYAAQLEVIKRHRVRTLFVDVMRFLIDGVKPVLPPSVVRRIRSLLQGVG